MFAATINQRINTAVGEITSCNVSLLQFVWALVLFGAATASGEESRLQVNVSKEEIRGTFAIGENRRLEFYTKIEGKYIVSVTTFSNLTSGVRVQLTSLKLPVTAIITTVKSSTC